MNILNLDGTKFVSTLEKLGHNVLSVGLYEYCTVCTKTPFAGGTLAKILRQKGFVPDLVLWCDQGNLPLAVEASFLDCPLVAFFIDTFCNPWHVPFARAFDLALVAQKDFLPLFAQGRSSEEWVLRWFPLFFADNLAEYPLPVFEERYIPASFVGTLRPLNIPQRLPFLESFKRRHPLIIKHGDFRPIFAQSKIVLNQSAFQEINFRVFEALAMGCALLNEDVEHGFRELFIPGEDVLPVYPVDDSRAAAAIAANYLDRPEELAEIARKGQEKVLKLHSLSLRTKELLDLAGSPEVAAARRRRKENPLAARKALTQALQFIMAELDKNTFAGLFFHYGELIEEINFPKVGTL